MNWLLGSTRNRPALTKGFTCSLCHCYNHPNYRTVSCPCRISNGAGDGSYMDWLLEIHEITGREVLPADVDYLLWYMEDRSAEWVANQL